MNLYRRFVVPALIDFALSGESCSRLRQRTVESLRGDVLEVGFGTGLNARFYAREATRVTTVDSNDGMSRRARRRIREARLDARQLTIDGTRLPFEAHSFDSVVTTWTLCSIDRVEEALAEIRRVLRPGGRYRFVEHGASPDKWVREWQDRLTPLQRRVADGCRLNRNVETLVRDAGFRSVAVERFYLEGFPRFAGYTYLGTATAGTADTRPPEAMIR